MQTQFCIDCIYWDGPIYKKSGDDWGQCTNSVYLSKISVEKETGNSETTAVFTEAYNGCPFSKKKGPQSLIDLSGEIINSPST